MITKQSKTKYGLDRQNLKASAFPSSNVSRYEYLNGESADTTTKSDLPPIPRLESDEEANERESLKILTPKILLTRLPVLLA